MEQEKHKVTRYINNTVMTIALAYILARSQCTQFNRQLEQNDPEFKRLSKEYFNQFEKNPYYNMLQKMNKKEKANYY